MDHTYVETHDLVESYLAGRLTESERDAFEAHYFGCATCLEQLEAASDFREGMLQVAAEDLARETTARARLGLLAGLAALSRRYRWALAGALLLLAALPSLWLATRNRALEGRRAALEARLHRLEQAGAADRRRLEAELGEERQARAAAAQPQVNVPLALLAAVRGGEPAEREPVNQIALPPAAGSLILTAELATVDFPAYRASLRAASGQEIWQAQGLHPDRRDTLVLLLPASLLPPGVYQLAVEGTKDDGRWFAVATYRFRVARRP